MPTKTSVLTLALLVSLTIANRLHDPLCGQYPQMGFAQIRVRKLIELILTKSPNLQELQQIETTLWDECVTVFVNSDQHNQD